MTETDAFGFAEVMMLDVHPTVTRTEMRWGEPGMLSVPTVSITVKPLPSIKSFPGLRGWNSPQGCFTDQKTSFHSLQFHQQDDATKVVFLPSVLPGPSFPGFFIEKISSDDLNFHVSDQPKYFCRLQVAGHIFGDSNFKVMMVVVCLPARVLFHGLKRVGVALEGSK